MQNLIFTDELFLTGGWEDFPNQSMGVTEIEGVVEKDELRIQRQWHTECQRQKQMQSK